MTLPGISDAERKHKVKCRLFGKDGGLITETEVESDVFLARTDNPFPASELFSAICTEYCTSFSYMVKAADDLEMMAAGVAK